jgi:hypothetical protein
VHDLIGRGVPQPIPGAGALEQEAQPLGQSSAE